jgi:hypothetical protein
LGGGDPRVVLRAPSGRSCRKGAGAASGEPGARCLPDLRPQLPHESPGQPHDRVRSDAQPPVHPLRDPPRQPPIRRRPLLLASGRLTNVRHRPSRARLARVSAIRASERLRARYVRVACCPNSRPTYRLSQPPTAPGLRVAHVGWSRMPPGVSRPRSPPRHQDPGTWSNHTGGRVWRHTCCMWIRGRGTRTTLSACDNR